MITLSRPSPMGIEVIMPPAAEAPVPAPRRLPVFRTLNALLLLAVIYHAGQWAISCKFQEVLSGPDEYGIGRGCWSPLVFDLDGKGVRTGAATHAFHIDGNGFRRRVDSLAAGNGLLIFDSDGDGLPGTTGLELFGDRTDLDGDEIDDGYRNGFEAFRALVDKAVREGVLSLKTDRDIQLDADALRRLEVRYGLRIRMGGVVGVDLSLAQAGIAAITVARGPSVRLRDFDGKGNDIERAPDATFQRADGTQGVYEDLWFAIRESQSPSEPLLRSNIGSIGNARPALR